MEKPASHLEDYKGPVLVPRRTSPGTWPLVGATVPLAVGGQASDLDRPAPIDVGA